MMLRLALITCCLVALGAAYPAPWWGWGPFGFRPNYAPYWSGYWNHNQYNGYRGRQPESSYKFTFHGQYPGKCESGQDGVFYVDDQTFAYCSGGQPVLQPCAEGSANPPLDHYNDGRDYGLYDFCSVNLVAKGYKPTPHPHKKPEDNKVEIYAAEEGKGEAKEEKYGYDSKVQYNYNYGGGYKQKVKDTDGNYKDVTYTDTKEFPHGMDKKY